MLIAAITYGLALAANLAVLAGVHGLARSAPRRYPVGIWPNGTPYRWGPVWVIYVAPVMVLALLVLFPVLFATVPARGVPPSAAFFGLFWLLFAETAWLIWWASRHNVELARGTIERLPFRELWPSLAIVLLTVGLLVIAGAGK